MDIRLRILRRILEIGSSDQYSINAIFSTDGSTALHVHDNRIGKKVVDSFYKYDTIDETSAFVWLDEWATVIRRGRCNGSH